MPIYRVPGDLIAIDLAGTYSELAGLRLRGRMQNGKVVAYPSRGEIMRGDLLRGQELLWVDDPIDAFFLQVQGSGRVMLDDGNVTRLGYGDSNGHPYRSIGRWLVDQRRTDDRPGVDAGNQGLGRAEPAAPEPVAGTEPELRVLP